MRRLGLLLSFLVTWPAIASPREDLLRLVPADAQLVVAIQSMRNYTEALSLGLPKPVRESPLTKALLASPELAQLQAVERRISADLGIPLTRLRDDLFGDAMVFAFRPGPAGREDGLFLTWAKDQRLPAELFDRINAFQKQSGELRNALERTHQGIPYTHRQKSRGPEEFYLIRGSIVAIASNEATMQEFIERLNRPSNFLDPAALNRLGLSDRLAWLWLNPRAFDVELSAKAKQAAGADAVALRHFQQYWSALDGIALAIGAAPDFEMNLTVAMNWSKLPQDARTLLATAGRPSALWASMPPETLLAVSGRLDGSALTGVIGGFMTTQARASAWDGLRQGLAPALGGSDTLWAVLRSLGPDWGMWLTSPPAEASEWLPRAHMAVRVQPQSPAVEPALKKALNLAALGLTLAYNSTQPDEIQIANEQQGEIEVRYLRNDKGFPPGIRPAFALKGGYLLLTSHPDAIRQFKPSLDLSVQAEVPWLRISATHIAKYLREHRSRLIDYIAQTHQLSTEQARERFDNLLLAVDLFESVTLHSRSTDQTGTLSLRLHWRGER